MDKDGIAGATQQVEGSIKEAIGKVTGDAELQAEGATDKATGKTDNTAGAAQGAARDTAGK